MLPESTPTDRDHEQIRRLIAAVDAVAIPTRYDNPDLPAWKDGSSTGNMPPMPQEGRPAMSQKATDASVLVLSAGVASVLVGGSFSLVLVASGHADPTVCGIVFGSPAVLALAVGRLLKHAKDVLPAEVHNHYEGPVEQRIEQHMHVEQRWSWKPRVSNRQE
jgi:hypothetical protein